MKRIGITPEQTVFREQERITAWLRSGEVEFFHIRKPQFTESQLHEYLSLFPADVRERLTLHDHHHLAAEFGVGGLHLNRRNPSVAKSLADKRISASCHSIGEFTQQQAHCAYCFLSPVFDSVSKQGYTSAFAPDTLKRAFAEGLLNGKAVALGGVTREKIPLLQEIGFSACASIGELWALPRTMFITHHNTRYNYVDGALAVLEGGLRFVQLRMKDATDEEVLAAAEKLRPACDQHGALLTVDDRIHLLESGLFDGVHVGKNDMPVAEAKKITGSRFLLGATCNTADDALKAADDGADYLGVGPFRFTETKQKLAPVLGLEGYENILCTLREHSLHSLNDLKLPPHCECNPHARLNQQPPATSLHTPSIPVYAIGGITADDLLPLKQAGVYGVAVSGMLLNGSNTANNSNELMKVFPC